MSAHIKSLIDALVKERDAETSAHQKLIGEDLSVRISAGYSWPHMRLSSAEPHYRGSALHFIQPNGADLHDGIEGGTKVLITPVSSMTPHLEGFCTQINDSQVEIVVRDVRVEELEPWLTKNPIALTKSHDTSTFDRYEQGLTQALQWEHPLKEALLGEWVPICDPKPSTSLKLNSAQQIAAGSALQEKHLCLIHGPPGTGKTHTLISIIKDLIEQSQRPWALSDSNAAADNILGAAVAQGLNPLRLGNTHRTNPKSWPWTLEGRMSNHPQQKAIQKLNREILKATGKIKYDLYKTRRHMVKTLRNQLLKEGDLVVTTLGTAARILKNHPPVQTILVDEATQAIEPAIWTAAVHTQKLILMGDPFQLGPVVKQPGNILERSLLQRLIEEHPLQIPMLNIQHRMSSPIQHLVSSIYGADYVPHPSVEKHLLSDIPNVTASKLSSRSRLFVDTAGYDAEEKIDPVSCSLFNQGEASIVKNILFNLTQLGLLPDQIAILTPYNAQKTLLRQNHPKYTVETINAFQGQEAEVVICSFVRSNPDNNLGFVADRRRLTVALTRARRLWIGIGDSSLLASNECFAELFDLLGEDLLSAWEELPC